MSLHTKIKALVFSTSLLSLAMLSGCSIIGPDFNDMTEAYEKAMDMHQKKSLLTNMLRASDNLPLIFTDVTTVTGTGAIATSNSIGANIQGVDPSTVGGYFSPRPGSGANISSSLTTNRSFTFSLGSLNNEEFFRGFLTDTTLDDMYFFMKTDAPPREFITALLVDSIEVKGSDGTKKTYMNDPASADYSAYRAVVQHLLDDGLTAEVTNDVVPIGPIFSKEDVAKFMPEISKLQQSKIFLRKVRQNPEGYQLSLERQRAKLCMDSPKESRHYGRSMDCGKAVKPDYTATTTGIGRLATANDSLVIKLRSTRSVFRYLGRIIALQMGPNPVVTQITVKNDLGQQQEIPILLIEKNARFSANQVIASTNYQGDVYSIPFKNSGYSAKIFDLLSVMVTMNKIPGSIPTSPGVLVR